METLLPSLTIKQGVRLQQCRRRVARFYITVDIVWDAGATWAAGRVQYAHVQCIGTRPSGVGTAQRSHRVCDDLDHAGWQRGERRGQLRAAVGRVVC